METEFQKGGTVEKKRWGESGPPYTGSLLKWKQHRKLGQAKARSFIWVSKRYRGPSNRVIFYWFPRCISREVDQDGAPETHDSTYMEFWYVAGSSLICHIRTQIFFSFYKIYLFNLRGRFSERRGRDIYFSSAGSLLKWPQWLELG